MSGDMNVRVAVRARPFNERERALGSSNVLTVSGGSEVTIRDPQGSLSPTSFTFDYAYGIDSTQAQVYNDVGLPIVTKATQGYNATIFAYGQTGSGKTYTMMGYDGDKGVIPLLNEDVFRLLEQRKAESPELQYLVTVSYLEIYNEVLKDLLNPSEKTLKIREHPEMGIYVEGLVELVVKSPAEVGALLKQGNMVRVVAETNMNARSSRSHSCFIVKIDQKKVEHVGELTRTTATNAKINLVDLAGSERAEKTGAEGSRLKEGAAINKSLSALGNVINALTEVGKHRDSSHVPYRDSKLTRLLQESLGGNALTVMLAALSPAGDNYDETLGTLRYASRAKAITNRSKRNEDVNDKVVRVLREEIDALRKALAEAAARAGSGGAWSGGGTGGGGGGERDAKMEQMEEMIANLERAKRQSWEEKERLSRQFEEERQKNLANDKKVLSVMQTIRDENLEVTRRQRMLQKEKIDLSQEFADRRERYGDVKAALDVDVAAYQEMIDKADAAAEAGEEVSVEQEAKMEALLAAIEARRTGLLEDREVLNALKQRITSNDESLELVEAELAAQKTLLTEDAALRAAIVDEVRSQVVAEQSVAIQSALETEKERLRRASAYTAEALVSQFRENAQEAHMTEARVAALERRVFKEAADRNLLLGELEAAKKIAAKEREAVELECEAMLVDAARENRRMFKQMADVYETELQQVRAELEQSRTLLALATQDVVALAERNAHLEKQLFVALSYESPAREAGTGAR